MTSLQQLEPRAQEQLSQAPYDRWITPDGDVSALFYRKDFGYLVRFPDQVDFEIDAENLTVRSIPALDVPPKLSTNLYHNSILPILGNYNGELNMHGSAISLGESCVAFLGTSRRGKTTLAGSFAQSGYPFLTEDVLGLEPSGGDYLVRPSRPVLRLFPDSAAFLLGREHAWDDDQTKYMVDASEALPFKNDSVPLGQIFILGPGDSQRVEINRLNAAAALAQLIQHSFILDVEDRQRLRGHFNRIGALADSVNCYELDYPRSYDQLPLVKDAIIELSRANG